jgi:hypothetical protein
MMLKSKNGLFPVKSIRLKQSEANEERSFVTAFKKI